MFKSILARVKGHRFFPLGSSAKPKRKGSTPATQIRSLQRPFSPGPHPRDSVREPEQHTLPGKQAEAEAVLTHRRVLLNPEPKEPTRPAHSLTYPEETSRPVSMAYPVTSYSAREIPLFMVAMKRVLGSFSQAVPALQLPDT